MSSINKHDIKIRDKVMHRMWEYLDENFHKFSDANKLKVALALATKNIPQQIEQELTYNKLPSITIGDKGEMKEFNVGTPPDSSTT